MSVINKMLKDLDRRDALTPPAAPDADAHVKAAWPLAGSNRAVALLVVAIVLVGAGAWAWHSRPIRSVSERAFQPVPTQQPALPSAPTLPAAHPATPPAPPASTPAVAQNTPEAAPAPAEAERESPKKAAAKAGASAQGRRDRMRDRGIARRSSTGKSPPSPSQPAESEYRGAVALLDEGRVSEAEMGLLDALRMDPSYTPARQAYVALLLEQGRVDRAERELIETLSANPSQGTFALALAQIYATQRDYPAALEVMDKAGAAGAGADFLYLRGVVLQQMGRDGEAADTYRRALAAGAKPSSTWMGLAISLDKLQRREEAVEAYRRALAAGPVTRDVKDYAERRLSELQ